MTQASVVELFNRRVAPMLNAVLGEGAWSQFVNFMEDGKGFYLSFDKLVVQTFNYIKDAVQSAFQHVADVIYCCDEQQYVSVTGSFHTE